MERIRKLLAGLLVDPDSFLKLKNQMSIWDRNMPHLRCISLLGQGQQGMMKRPLRWFRKHRKWSSEKQRQPTFVIALSWVVVSSNTHAQTREGNFVSVKESEHWRCICSD
ncbi:unnamed protein product [Linum trigynum]|uniref:Uncharacterized protein n=1 Tax=Linum trigynum TaxID=586398 RepID=A0AAV2CPB1_9ROSI